MELVYLWVEDYKNIHQQGFNFSGRYRCDYDHEKNELTIDKNKEYVHIFPKNINVTAIVGENGSGKSGILEALYLMPDYEDKKIFYVYTFDYTTFYYRTNFDFSIKSNSNILINKDINVSTYLGLSFIPNLQKNLLIAKKKEDTPSYTENYKMEFIYKFIEVFKKNNQIFKNINDKFVFDKLRITIHRESLISKNELKISQGLAGTVAKIPYEKYESFLEKTYKVIENLIVKAFPEGNKRAKILALPLTIKKSSGDLIQDIKISFLILYMNHLVSLFSNIENINHTNFDLVSHIFDDLSFENLFEKIKEFEQNSNLHNIHLNDIQNNVKLVEDWIEFSEKNKTLFIKGEHSFSLSLDLNNDFVKKILEFQTLFTINAEFNNCILLDIELLSYEGAINFFGLSSGEQKRLSLYIEIIYSYFFSNSKILLIDEPDTFLHPQWSKIFINDLLKSLPKETEKKHLVLTSHSPFILSDLPKENVVFLDTYKAGDKEVQDSTQKIGNCKNVSDSIKINTFGANIHTLLSDAFFMENGLMGEFAKSKINAIVDFYNEVEKHTHNETKKVELKIQYEEKKEAFWNIQSIIGEAYLKQVVKNHLVEIEKILLGKDEAKSAEISRIKVYLESLEND